LNVTRDRSYFRPLGAAVVHFHGGHRWKCREDDVLARRAAVIRDRKVLSALENNRPFGKVGESPGEIEEKWELDVNQIKLGTNIRDEARRSPQGKSGAGQIHVAEGRDFVVADASVSAVEHDG